MTISLSHVRFNYPFRAPVFEDLNLNISSFPCVVLGPNGAGKSTLLSLVAARLLPKRGEVAIEGATTTRAASRRRLRSLVGWLPQDVRPIAGFRVRQQVAYVGWLKGARYNTAWLNAPAALEAVELGALANSWASQLSGGQRRRLGIAQTLVSSPSVVLLDEPYAGLDPEQRGILRNLLTRLSDSANIVVSTHQVEDFASSYQWVVVISDGRVLFSGSSSVFLDSAPVDTPAVSRAEAAYAAVMRGAVTSSTL